MRIVIVGTGYVGLVTGTCFAEMGNNVICVDTNAQKIEMLQNGKIPIYEPGLEGMVIRNMEAGELKFSTSLATSLAKAQVVFIAVGTPMEEDGSADINAVLRVAESIGELMTSDLAVISQKSH